MHDIADAFAAAWQLILSGNSTLLGIVSMSLGISLTAVLFASCIGLPLGASLAITPFPGRNAAVVAVNSLMGLPPVVVGLWFISLYRVPVRSKASDCYSPRLRW